MTTRGALARLRIRAAAVLVPGLLASLLVPSSTAQADDSGSLSMKSSMRPVNAEPLDLAALQQQPALRGLSSESTTQALLPRETVGPAKTYAPLAPEDSARDRPPVRRPLAPQAPAAVTLPEPSHTMTPAECVLGLATKTFYIKSRYAMCSGKQFDQVWLRNGRPVGTSHFDVLAIGTVPANSRTITVTYHFTDFTAAADNGAASMGITTKGGIVQSWPSSATYTQGGVTMPFTRTWTQLLGADTYKHTVTAAAGQGTQPARADLLSAVYVPNISIKAPPAWTTEPITGGDLFMLPPRWDKAPYLPNAAAGAATWAVVTPLQYSTAAGAPAREVALHIQKAFTTPGLTQPPMARKDVPGKSASAPLTRLYWDTRRRDLNRNRSVYNCQKYFGEDYATSAGYARECDEYPMASTYEGAGHSDYDPLAEPGNFSVLPVTARDNGDAGILLGQFYDKNRIVDGPDDGFIVEITS
ncbi:NucA/NucB deoxyribonuclease domain-containing protein [Streptomyces sp. NPDC055186]